MYTGESPAQPGDGSYSSPGYSVPYYTGYGDDSKKRKPSYATPYYPREYTKRLLLFVLLKN